MTSSNFWKTWYWWTWLNLVKTNHPAVHWYTWKVDKQQLQKRSENTIELLGPGNIDKPSLKQGRWQVRKGRGNSQPTLHASYGSAWHTGIQFTGFNFYLAFGLEGKWVKTIADNSLNKKQKLYILKSWRI